jgi:transcriptional antiterminator RfaH
LFPGYLFVRLDLGRDRWRAVYSTVGVRTLVSAGDRPLAVPPEVIEEIRAREDSSGLVVLGSGCTFRRGDRVRFAEGPLVDTTGLFDCRNDGERVTVLLDLLGRQVKANVPLRAIMPCACF